MEGITNTISLEALSNLFKEQDESIEKEISEHGEESFEENTELNDTQSNFIEDNTQEEVNTPRETVLSKTIKNLVDKGTWSDYSLNIDGEEYDSIEDLISKVEVTDDLFQALAEKQLEEGKEELKSKTISIEGLDETRVKIIEGIKSGLNYQPLLEINDQHIQPLKDMDLSNVIQAEGVCYQKLKVQYGDEVDVIQFKLNKLKEDGLLESTAEEIRQEYISEFERMISDKSLEVKQAQEEVLRKIKEDKKDLRATLKEKEYSDTFSKKIVDFIYEKDNNGSEDWYTIVKSKLGDKDFAIRFAHSILDEEDFINRKFSDFKRNDKISTLERLNITLSSKKSKDGGKAPDKDKRDTSLFSEGVQFIQQK